MGITEKLDERLERIEAALVDLREARREVASPPEQGPEYLDTVGAAEFLRVSKQSLALWRGKGGGPTYSKVGGTVRYSRHSLIEWMRENER